MFRTYMCVSLLVFMILRTYVIAGVDNVQDICHCWCWWCSGHLSLLVLMMFRTFVIAGADDVQDICHCWCWWCSGYLSLLVLMMFRTFIIAGADVRGMCHCWCWWCSGHLSLLVLLMFRTCVIAGADDVQGICYCWCWWCSGHGYRCWCWWCLGHVSLLVLMIFRTHGDSAGGVAGGRVSGGFTQQPGPLCHQPTVPADTTRGWSVTPKALLVTDWLVITHKLNPLLTLHKAGKQPIRPCWLLTDWLLHTNLTHCLLCTRLSVAHKALLVVDSLVITYKLNPLFTLHKAGQWPIRPCWLLTDWLLHTNLTHCLLCTRLSVAHKVLLVVDSLVITYKLNPLFTLHEAVSGP